MPPRYGPWFHHVGMGGPKLWVQVVRLEATERMCINGKLSSLVRVHRHWRTRSETICRAWILAMPFFLFLCKTFMPSLKRQRYTRAPQVKRVFYNEHAS